MARAVTAKDWRQSSPDQARLLHPTTAEEWHSLTRLYHIEDLRQCMQEENDRETAIRNQLTSQVAPAKPVVKLTNQEIIDMARTMKENWDHFELEHKKLIMHTLFSEIVIDSYGEVVGGPGQRVACEIKSFQIKKEADNHRLFTQGSPYICLCNH
jgi:hypothetical protein